MSSRPLREKAARRQRESVSDASHELRSPIAVLKTQLEVALAHPDDPHWERVARDALRETERLERVVNDLLDLARAEERRPRREEIELRTLIEEELARRSDERIALEAESMTVQGDREQL